MSFIKIHLDNYKIGNTEFALYYDGEFKKLHILDLDQPNRMTVTNAACQPFFSAIDAYLMFNYNIKASWEEYDIYLYGTDGIISEFEPGTNAFKHVEPWDGHIYDPFKKISNQRFFDLNI